MRVAFVTPEYAAESPRHGGLGNYVRRMAGALVAQGHQAEVFVPSRASPGTSEADGIVVHRVTAAVERRPVRALLRILGRLRATASARALCVAIDAWTLAAALRRRSRETRFDLVQSADHKAVALFLPARRAPHLLRCCNDDAETARRNGVVMRHRAGEDALARLALRRADRVYAPSRFLAMHLERSRGIRVEVLAPPAFLEVKPLPAPPRGLPERYFVHFGQLTPVKGTALLCDALLHVFEQQPDLAMVWAGRDPLGLVEPCLERLGRHRVRVRHLGKLTRPELYAVVAGAEASVLPSLFDNLPNSAIESLLLGVPVIGSDGASLDELVTPGVDGLLVPVGDAAALADAMLRHWRGESGVRRGFVWQKPEMRPEAAVAGLFALAGLHVD